MEYYDSKGARELRYRVEMEKHCMEDAGLNTDGMITADDVIGLTDEEVVDEAGLMGLI